MIGKLNSVDKDFAQKLQNKLAWESVSNTQVNRVVNEIIDNIRNKGDEALLSYSQQFDNLKATNIKELIIYQDELKQAFDTLDAEQKTALKIAAERIKNYHKKQLQKDWSYTENDGTKLGQKITPIDRVGLYVPGGIAAYPSSVLMNAIPAKVAKVKELIMVVPTPNSEKNQLVLAAAFLAGVDKVFTVGGAQAVAALAYGTKTIPKVDKIVGPGNIYVATAKRFVFGQVGIDMIAGPSEILIICDGKTNPDWIAMDLFSQAEHDEDAQSILLCPDADFITQVEESIKKLLPTMLRKDIIQKSLTDRGLLIKTKNMTECIEISNKIAPEHLELSVDNSEELLKDISHAGAIFMGRYTCEALGDYCAGPNHILPTSSTARFSSPLGVYDFQKRSSLIQVSTKGADTLGRVARTLAFAEGLDAHALSAQYRLLDK